MIFYHIKIFDDRKETFDTKLKEFDLLIFKKIPVFESVMKNILTYNDNFILFYIILYLILYNLVGDFMKLNLSIWLLFFL